MRTDLQLDPMSNEITELAEELRVFGGLRSKEDRELLCKAVHELQDEVAQLREALREVQFYRYGGRL